MWSGSVTLSAIGHIFSFRWTRLTLHRIVFRAFQGIGGGGMYTMVFVILPEMVTSAEYSTYAALISAVFALANFAGPMLGGVINNHTIGGGYSS